MSNNTIFIVILVGFLVLIFLIGLPQIFHLWHFLWKKTSFRRLGKSSQLRLVRQLYEAIDYFSKNKIGSLITIARKDKLDISRTDGIKIDANISSSLIVAIFNKESPLHDGSIIIENDKIVYASTYFKISAQSIDNRYGARHRAALGISEQTDALAIIVSETNGQISFAKSGSLIKVTIANFQDQLVKELQ